MSSPVWDRVWVTLFLASAMIISHASAVGGSRSPCASIYIRLHPQDPTKRGALCSGAIIVWLCPVVCKHARVLWHMTWCYLMFHLAPAMRWLSMHDGERSGDYPYPVGTPKVRECGCLRG